LYAGDRGVATHSVEMWWGSVSDHHRILYDRATVAFVIREAWWIEKETPDLVGPGVSRIDRYE
jgi:hypothetical protein